MHHHHCGCALGWWPGYGPGAAPSWPGYVWPGPYVLGSLPWCAMCGQPQWCCRCGKGLSLYVPQEIALASAPASAQVEMVVGGVADVQLVLEFLPDGAAPALKATLEPPGSGSSSTFNPSPVPAGYNLKQDLPAAEPGTKLTLEATDCFARLRWCEVVEY